ncbi:MAG: glycosyltransferase family 39 protein [Thermoguttaceae bacterium]
MNELTQNGRRTAIDQLLIVAAACAILLPNLGRTGLWDMDEALYSTVAREMLQANNWIVPWFNGQLFPEKPPLMFWTMMGGFELFGVNEFGARFFSVLMGIGTALAAFHLGRLLFSPRIGLWTGLITCSTIVFTISARAATVDCALTFVTTLAMLLFVLALRGQELPNGSAATSTPLRWPYAVAMYACVGLAVLAKGPVGMLLPLAAMGLYLLAVNGWRSLFRSAWQMRPITALVVIAAVALPWYIAVGVKTHGEWLEKFIWVFNLRPFQQPIQSHGDALAIAAKILYYFYHIPGVLFGFFPWAVFLGPALVNTVRELRRRPSDVPTDDVPATSCGNKRNGIVLAVCWFGVWFVFWSICKTKLPHYLLPAYPALAMLVACWIDRWFEDKSGAVPAWEPRNAWISTILVGMTIAIALPIVAAYRLPGEQSLGLYGLILVLGGAWCWWESRHEHRGRAAAAFALTSVVFLAAAFGFAALQVDRHQNAKPMIAAIHKDWASRSSPPPIATYGLFRESTVFYAGRPVARCSDDPATGATARQLLKQFLAKHDRAYVIASNEDEREITDAYPPGTFTVVGRWPRFLEPQSSASSEMIVLRAVRR